MQNLICLFYKKKKYIQTFNRIFTKIFLKEFARKKKIIFI